MVTHGRSNLDKISDFLFQSFRISITVTQVALQLYAPVNTLFCACSSLASHYLWLDVGFSVNTYRGKNILGQEQKNISQLTLYVFPSESISLHSVLYITPFSHVHM